MTCTGAFYGAAIVLGLLGTGLNFLTAWHTRMLWDREESDALWMVQIGLLLFLILFAAGTGVLIERGIIV